MKGAAPGSETFHFFVPFLGHTTDNIFDQVDLLVAKAGHRITVPLLCTSKGFCIDGNTTHFACASYLLCRHVCIQFSVTYEYHNAFMRIITRTNQTPNIQLVSVVCMQVYLSMPSYPPNSKITDYKQEWFTGPWNACILFCKKKFAEEREGSEF